MCRRGRGGFPKPPQAVVTLVPKVSPVGEHGCAVLAKEPSHGRGAPEVSEPLTLGAQYLTRYNTWKKFIRATRPALLFASPKTSIRVKFSS